MLVNIVWAFSGDGQWKSRKKLSDFVRNSTIIQLPPNASLPIIDYYVENTGEWVPWSTKVCQIEIEAQQVSSNDVIPTMDTIRHESLLGTWLSERKPLVLCGPPGSGKTMTLLKALRSIPDMEVISVNFSSSTTPELLMKSFEQYCEYRRTPNGIVLAPIQLTRWLIIFCDEINLPIPDKYSTQRVISFIRQLVEQNGFYRTSDKSWVTLERIQFVGACNPPTDPGRNPLSSRFLRHVPIIYVDYPGRTSLLQIYGTYSRALLRSHPTIRGMADSLTEAMVDFYLQSQERFTQDDQPHYVYSPRELTRWVRGICEVILPLDSVTVEDLVRLWAHEALRLFHDRLVHEDERQWTDQLVDSIGTKYFSGSCDNIRRPLIRPILYSYWLNRNYMPVDKKEIEEYVRARLKQFYEEELDVRLALFDQMIDHVLRIDRIFRQPQGHLLLIGVSGSGKTTLSRFVAWINGFSIVQLKVHSKYSSDDFDDDIRMVLRRVGCKNEKICFILDESNMLETGFLERLNTLLANGEVPGLFEGDEYATLLSQIKDAAQRLGTILDSSEELYRWFTTQINRNLHVVFTMNPSGDDLRERAATSPALFNRCVLNWFGDWSNTALYQVGQELTSMIEIDKFEYGGPRAAFEPVTELVPQQVQYRHAVVNTFVQMHNIVRHVTDAESRKGHRITAITPRHFLDCIKQFIRLHREKRRHLEEERIHLNNGLKKIIETEEQVKELKKSLTEKGTELQEKQKEADSKLKQMISDQREAENEKRESEKLQNLITKETEMINAKKSEVEKQLSEVRPAVDEAKGAVQNIKKTQLVEIKTLAQPPNAVKITVESVCLLLGETVGTDWKAIRGIIVKEDFIQRIIQFNTENITPEILQQMRKYQTNSDWDYEKVNRASLACGPLLKWAKAQLSYAQMLNRVEPLNSELRKLENDSHATKQKQDELQVKITELEHRIQQLKDEYQELVSESTEIKKELDTVQQKVNRSTQLLKSLRVECDRWEQSRDGFSQQMDTLIGDVLLSSAFLSYSGIFDQHLRDILFHRWSIQLQQAAITFRNDLARIEYLSTADERLKWQNDGLSKDDLCMENGVILCRYIRFPLIIDPSGQTIEFLSEKYSKQSLVRTSFLDKSFRKNLESALRFGSVLLVQDVERYDPILNPVLNLEQKRTSGRVLITIGDQDIDLSPQFKIFMFTRDSSVEFPVDVCSRVTFVNFTITRGSLEMQCLNRVLRSERPDIDKKRNDLLKLQGEFAVQLRQLEKALLDALNESKGKILDDDSVITTLERLKTEAQEVAKKSAETDQVMKEVETVSQKYTRLAQACSFIYLALQQMHEAHFLYHYSLDFLLEIFNAALNCPKLASTRDFDERLSTILAYLFYVAYSRISQGMLHSDKTLLALVLLRIYLRCGNAEPEYEKEFDYLLPSSSKIQSNSMDASNSKSATTTGFSRIPGLNSTQVSALHSLTTLPVFKNAVNTLRAIPPSELPDWVDSDKPELNVPPTLYEENDNDLTPVKKALNQLLVIHALRPDRLVASLHLLIIAAFGSDFMEQDKVLDLRELIENEVSSKIPILMCSVVGYDVSGRIEDLALDSRQNVTPIAIGSAEGFSNADKALNQANTSGNWLLLKNVHLAPSYLTQLEKRLHSLKPHPKFRLILTAEINPKLPVSMIQASRVLVFEPSTGLKANLFRSLSSLPSSRIAKQPAERSRIYFLVCWFHAIVQERLRYQPLGWANSYEISDAELRVTLETLDSAVDSIAMGRTNVKPDKLPWKALRTFLSQCIYGGKIVNEFDQKLLDTLLDHLFQPRIFQSDFILINDIDGKGTLLHAPEETTNKDGIIDWVHQIRSDQMPNWIGLPNNAEKVLLTVRGNELLRKMLNMSDNELAYTEDDSSLAGKAGSKKQPQWMIALSDHCQSWLKALPEELYRLKRTKENIKQPLFRFFEREINLGASLHSKVRQDLNEVLSVFRGEQKRNNTVRSLISDLNKGQVPQSWLQYAVPSGLTAHEWMNDFVERIRQLVRIQQSSENFRNEEIWLGGLFFPEAYITATRQLVAKSNGWSLEQLCMHVSVIDGCDSAKPLPGYFCITGLRAVGATCSSPNRIHLTDEIYSDIGRLQFSWTLESASAESILVPVYLYANRARLLFCLDLTPDFEKSLLSNRGVAILSNTKLE